ncbi:MAG: prepilin-type N-terminal cleavage/methylation domain-containing protein [Candidatus Ratteibacteria bacterium]|jgi:prepilin-type N-terminal cleavage/methylation domain-containing protein
MTLSTGQRSSNSCGFTLIELLLVSVIISVLIGISAPRLNRSVSSLALRNCSKDIVALIKYTQQTAIIEETNYRINLDPKKNKVWPTRRKSGAETETYEIIKTSLGKPYSLPQKVKITSLKFTDTNLTDQNYLTCYPNGYTDKATLTISDGKETFSITTTGRIGQVIVKKNE